MTVLALTDLTSEERAALDESPRIRRLSAVELFRVGPDGLEAIGDDTLRRRLDAAERESLRQGYAEAVAEELLQQPEAAS